LEESVCVILSGGASNRFGSDKLVARVGGRAVIARVLDAAKSVASKVYLSVHTEDQGVYLQRFLDSAVKFVVDDADSFLCRGPALGICSSLRTIACENILFVPGDVPWIESAALSNFIESSSRFRFDVSTISWSSGRTENLIQLVKRRRVLDMVTRIAGLRGNRMRPSDILRGVRQTLYLDASSVTQNPYCFSNVNTNRDLAQPVPRGRVTRSRPPTRVMNEPKKHFWKALNHLSFGEYVDAGARFEAEAVFYEKCSLGQVVLHCLLDAAFCAQRAGLDSSRLDAQIKQVQSRLDTDS
jgi:molybdopterin-guanine dinucleotide biosynthesis protein A